MDLLGIVDRDTVQRGRRFLRDLRLAILPIVSSVLLQALIYWTFIFQAGRDDWDNLLIVVLILALVPLLAVLLMVSIRRQDFPISTACVVTAILFNFAVAILSALRIPISYTGLLFAAPVPLFFVSYTSVLLHRAQSERVAILAFPKAEWVRDQVGNGASILGNPKDNVVDVDRILFDGAAHHTATWSSFLTRAYMLGLEVTPWIRYLETRLGKVDIESFDLAHIAYTLGQIYYLRLKRLLDVTGVIVAVPIVLPVCLLIAIYIRLVGGSPILFRQKRRGYGGSEFTMLKFRTMVRNANNDSARKNDERIITGCHFLRRMRLDELPQLINILRGEMSWIGPRPVAIPIAESLEATVPQYACRHLVLPGLTGWAQVSQGYASTFHEEFEKLSFDLYYVKQISFDIDLMIFVKTIKIILLRIGSR